MLEPTPLYGGNADFLEGLYEQYLRDPASVDERWRAYFERSRPAAAGERPHGPIQADIAERARAPGASYRCCGAAVVRPGPGEAASSKQAAVSRLIQIWTNRGHLVAKVDPLGSDAAAAAARPRAGVLRPVRADLDTEFFTGSRNGAVPKRKKLRDILAQLEFIYGGHDRRRIRARVGLGRAPVAAGSVPVRPPGPSVHPEERRNILWQLTAAEGLERYLHTKYVGQKRFSLEGGDVVRASAG